jgi:hypothetical protein
MSATHFPADHAAFFPGNAVSCAQLNAAIGSARVRSFNMKSPVSTLRISRAGRRGCETTYMNDAEHAELVKLEKQGKIIVGVDRPTARSFLISSPISKIETATGYAPYLEKGTVFFFFLSGPLALLSSLIAAIFAFGWWGIAVDIVCLVLYLGYQMMSSRGGAGALLISILLAGAVVIHFLDLSPLSSITLFGVLYLFALWSTRMLYVSATSLYRMMALRDDKLFNLLKILRSSPARS